MDYNAEEVIGTGPCQFKIFASILSSCSIRVWEHIELERELHFQVYFRACTKAFMMFEPLCVTPLTQSTMFFDVNTAYLELNAKHVW
jgi:hypothetical protein